MSKKSIRVEEYSSDYDLQQKFGQEIEKMGVTKPDESGLRRKGVIIIEFIEE